MLKVATLASGSAGNCAVASDGHIHILIDAGISARRVIAGLRDLGLDPAGIKAILITHEHSDHISGLPVLCRQIGAELYATEPTARYICDHSSGLAERFRVFHPGEAFALDSLVVRTFPVSHDCVCPVGYAVEQSGYKAAWCTDLGAVTTEVLEGIRGAQLLIGEFNYDVDMLQAGPYPPHLKKRILGKQGHLSNELGGKLACWAVEHGTRWVVMAHLSQENNSPATARRAAEQALEAAGIRAGTDVLLSAAPRSGCSGWMEA